MRLDDVLDTGYELEFDDRFDRGELDRSRWLPHHLPQWSSMAESAARYDLTGNGLTLRVDADQEPWCRPLDGTTRVSSLQTGVFSGPLGSSIGQHRFSPDAVVREVQESRRLFTPQYGVIGLRARATDDPTCMVALWMIGFEDRPERSAEICICEIFGRTVEPDSAVVGMGVHPFGDPAITDDFAELRLPIDVREVHEYAAEWTPTRVTFFVDGRSVRTVWQAPQYPMQLMLGLYEFRNPDAQPGAYPKRFPVESVWAYRAVPRRRRGSLSVDG